MPATTNSTPFTEPLGSQVPPSNTLVIPPNSDQSGTDLAGLDLSGQDLCGVNFRGARLSGANLSGAELMGADLTGADLRETNFERAGLANASLDGANGMGANFSGASFVGTSMVGTQASLANFQGARFAQSDLRDAKFVKADFTQAELYDCNVRNASFRDSTFANAKVRGLKNFARSEWVHADLRTADLSSAQLLQRHAADQNFLWEFRNQSRASEVMYGIWWLTSDCGRSFARWGLITALLAICFAGVYRVVGVDFGPNETVLSPLYFSVVTLTTLGYGDVLPTTTAAQVAVIFETVLGYVMLGGLLAMFSSTVARRS